MDDILECFKITQADAVMSSEGLLANPALFHKFDNLNTVDLALGSSQATISSFDYKFSPPSAKSLASEYLDIIKLYPPPRSAGSVARYVNKLIKCDCNSRALTPPSDLNVQELISSSYFMEDFQRTQTLGHVWEVPLTWRLL